MLAAFIGGLLASQGFLASAAARPAVQVRASDATMMSRMNGEVWDFANKKALFDEWDPESPRTYDNFNPFERNDEGSMADTNGCFPGQSRGYKSPVRPDQSWEIMQKEQAAMKELETDPKFSVKGKPGNWSPKWQENLGAPP